MSTDFAHKNILVLGAGVTGTSVARFLQSRGAQVTLTDDNSEGAVKPSEVSLKDFDAVVISPGWRQDHPLVAQILNSSIEMLNEIDIAWSLRAERAPSQKWIALTGTNGKTTTVEMTAAILQAAGIKAVACGNVGDTVIDAVDRDDAYEVLVIEEYEHAKARGAKIYCEIGGQGLTSDGYHIAAPDPEGSGVQRAIKFALQNSGLSTKDIVHLNAHATSTPAGDVAEANALRKALGADADHVAVSATKSMTGHLLGGAGAIESVFIVKALQDRLAPPTINIENLDPAVTVDVVRDTPRQLPAGDIAALNDSFGFGGHNVVLAFKSL